MKMKYTPIEIVNHFYRLAEDYVHPPQVVIVIASDATEGGQCAFRSNLVGGNEAMIRVLRELADNMENEGTKPVLRLVQPKEDGNKT